MDKAKMLAEIIEYGGPPLRKEGDFTWDEFATEWESIREDRLTVHRAKKILNDMVKSGLLQTALRYDAPTSRMRNVWWAVDKAKKGGIL